MNGREIDAALAAAIGCKVKWKPGVGIEWPYCTCQRDQDSGLYPHGEAPNTGWLKPYYTAPTWGTTGQLIEGLAEKGWRFTGVYHPEKGYGARFWSTDQHSWVYADSCPKAVAEAARRALGIEA